MLSAPAMVPRVCTSVHPRRQQIQMATAKLVVVGFVLGLIGLLHKLPEPYFSSYSS